MKIPGGPNRSPNIIGFFCKELTPIYKPIPWPFGRGPTTMGQLTTETSVLGAHPSKYRTPHPHRSKTPPRAGRKATELDGQGALTDALEVGGDCATLGLLIFSLLGYLSIGS